MKDLIHSIIEALVDDVEAIKVEEITGNQTNIIELQVHKSDMGKVIGKQGRTADAIRTIINCASAKAKKKYLLKIVD